MKLFYRGYWVSKCYKWLSIGYWAAYSFCFRTLTFFASANPAIFLGGMLDEKKSDIYKLVPDRYLPSTIVIDSFNFEEASEAAQNIGYPVILKPDVGYRGFGVKRIKDEASLKAVSEDYKGQKMLIQAFFTEPKEYSVMYYFIDATRYGISSITEKHLPLITGDGVSNIAQLIKTINNPFLDKTWILKNNQAVGTDILAKGESFIIDHVGNFSRGSRFENLTNQVTPALVTSFHQFFTSLSGMYFCRADVKATSFEALCRGEFKLLEINGAKSEPIHIYDTSMSFWDIIKATRDHWRLLFQVVSQHRNSSIKIPSSMDGIRSYLTLKKLVN